MKEEKIMKIIIKNIKENLIISFDNKKDFSIFCIKYLEYTNNYDYSNNNVKKALLFNQEKPSIEDTLKYCMKGWKLV